MPETLTQTESKTEHSPAYNWFVALFYPDSDEARQLKDSAAGNYADSYTDFISSLNKSDKDRLQEIRTGQKGEDREFIKTLAEGFEQFVAQRAENE